MNKICKICGEVKELNDFYNRAARCKSCILYISKQKTKDKWCPVVSFDNEIWVFTKQSQNYLVSNFSRIKTVTRVFVYPNGKSQIRREHLIKTSYAQGYQRAELDGVNYQWHRVVAEVFIPNPENKPYINHINGIKSDNRIENLEWCTQSENVKHSFRIGTQSNKGQNHPLARFTNAQIVEIKKMISNKIKGRVIAEMFKVHESTISKIKVGKHWNYQELQSI